MDRDKLNKWLTLTANLAVVAGIVFLAFELRQNNELLKAEIRTIRHNVRAADYLLPVEHEQYANALIKKRHGDPLTEYEKLILNRTIATTLYNYQYVFTEYKLGENRGKLSANRRLAGRIGWRDLVRPGVLAGLKRILGETEELGL